MVVSSDHKHSRSSEKIRHMTYQVPYQPGFVEEHAVKAIMEKSLLHGLISINKVQSVMCECLLNSTELLQKLRNFDLVVYEGVALCAVLVADLLDIRRVAVFSAMPPPGFQNLVMLPSPVSYIPSPITRFTDKMSFSERVINLGTYLMSLVVFDRLFASSMVFLKAKYNITPERSFKEAYGNTDLVMFSVDFALEFPRPLPPGKLL